MTTLIATLTPGIAVAPIAGYAALGVILRAYPTHPRLESARDGIRDRLNDVWYLVRWEEGERSLVHHSELRPYPVEE